MLQVSNQHTHTLGKPTATPRYVSPVNPLSLKVSGSHGKLYVYPNSGFTYVRVTLQGRVHSSCNSGGKATLFHCSNIVDKNVGPFAYTEIPFKILIPTQATLEMTPQRQKEWKNAMSDYVNYKKGVSSRTDTLYQESHSDLIYNYIVDSRVECSHDMILPSYYCPETGSRIEYEIVATGYIGSQTKTISTKMHMKIDPSYPSACLLTGVDPYGYFGLTDSYNDRLCVKRGNVCVPIPKPLRIGKLNQIAVFGSGAKKLKVSLQTFEYIRADCTMAQHVKTLVRNEVVFSGYPSSEKIPLQVPAGISPSFATCQLRLDYKLFIETDSMSFYVPVGVNYSGREGP